MGYTSLIFAAQGGHLETVRLLMEKEADVQAVSKASHVRKRAQTSAMSMDLISTLGLRACVYVCVLYKPTCQRQSKKTDVLERSP